MISQEVYEYIRQLLLWGKFQYPIKTFDLFPSGFVPQHLKCHITASQVAVEFGFIPVVGITFLDKSNMLYPWPHIVNSRHGQDLVDFSPALNEPDLGFIVMGWGEWEMWRKITLAYIQISTAAFNGRWNNKFADSLTDEFLIKLRGNKN
jgi:hypothetical protein